MGSRERREPSTPPALCRRRPNDVLCERQVMHSEIRGSAATMRRLAPEEMIAQIHGPVFPSSTYFRRA
jgi:hypothetical protein